MSDEPQVDEDRLGKAMDSFALLHKKLKGYLPLIMHKECYRYFGNTVRIAECNIYDSVKNAEVTVLGPFDEGARVEFSELEWEYSPVFSDFMRSGVSQWDMLLFAMGEYVPEHDSAD